MLEQAGQNTASGQLTDQGMHRRELLQCHQQPDSGSPVLEHSSHTEQATGSPDHAHKELWVPRVPRSANQWAGLQGQAGCEGHLLRDLQRYLLV